METDGLYEELAHELISGLTHIGRRVTPVVLNSTRGETALLMTLFRKEVALSPGELADASHVSSARVANILRSLEEKGLVTRSHSDSDRRRVEVSLTDAGRADAEARHARRQASVAEYLSALGEDDARELVRIVGRSGDILGEIAERGCAHEAR